MENYRNKNLPQTGLLTSSTRTSTILVSSTKISIAKRSYPGGLLSGSTGGIGKGPKLPNGTSSGTNLPPSNKEDINLTSSQTKEAIFNPNKTSEPYMFPQYATKTEDSSSTPYHPHYTPNSATKDPFKPTQLDKQKELAKEMDKILAEQQAKKQVEHMVKKHTEEMDKKLAEENFKKAIFDKLTTNITATPTSKESVYPIPPKPMTQALPPKKPSSNNPEIASIKQKITSISIEPASSIPEDANCETLGIFGHVETINNIEQSPVEIGVKVPPLAPKEDLPISARPESLLNTKNEKPQTQEEKLLLELRSRKLIDDKEDALTMKGHELLKKITENKETYKVNYLDIISNKQHVFSIGILEITKEKETLALLGLHTHMIVLYETMKGSDKKIIFGFLTSSNTTGTICLSETQPFALSDEKNKKQRFSILALPLVAKSNDIKPLPCLDTKSEGFIDQQSIGENYIAQPDVNKILQDNFTCKIIPIIIEKKGELPVYNGAGLTCEIGEKLLDAHDKEMEQKVKAAFSKYKNIKI